MDFETKADAVMELLMECDFDSQGMADRKYHISEALREAYEAGRKDENEACAKLVETECINHTAGMASARIRARGPNATPLKGKDD